MILDTIVARKREEVKALRTKGLFLPEQFMEKQIDPPRGFTRALLDYDGVSIIAEAKKASPSKGIICKDFDPVAIALNYAKNGAQAISVLTDVDFFSGSLLYLMQVREAVALPVLRKDFIIDPIQIEEARIHGADAILLIAAILDQVKIKEFKDIAAEAGMDSLVEVHDEDELEKALAAEPEIIGINNRNLNDFSVDLNTTFRLKKLIPDTIAVVSESGLRSEDDLQALVDGEITAALIGESLMRAGSESPLLSQLRV